MSALDQAKSQTDDPERGSCAGGVVVLLRHARRVAIVESKHRGNWCPPKGGREKGESTTQCALRELREESGLRIDEEALVPGLFLDEVKQKVCLFVVFTVMQLQSIA